MKLKLSYKTVMAARHSSQVASKKFHSAKTTSAKLAIVKQLNTAAHTAKFLTYRPHTQPVLKRRYNDVSFIFGRTAKTLVKHIKVKK